jgi:hypothetical protein
MRDEPKPSADQVAAAQKTVKKIEAEALANAGSSSGLSPDDLLDKIQQPSIPCGTRVRVTDKKQAKGYGVLGTVVKEGPPASGGSFSVTYTDSEEMISVALRPSGDGGKKKEKTFRISSLHLQPVCVVCDGVSGTQRASKCAGCGIARYCSVAHQKEDWPKHKAFCKANRKKAK